MTLEHVRHGDELAGADFANASDAGRP
jgi:hypothetical protein